MVNPTFKTQGSLTPNIPNTTKVNSSQQDILQSNQFISAFNTIYTEETNNTRVFANFSFTPTQGQIVSLSNSSGTLIGVLANATDNTIPAYGFINLFTPTSGSSGIGEVKCIGLNNYCTNLTPGEFCYLDITSGNITQTKPSTVGNIIQPIGFAISSTSMFFDLTYNFTQIQLDNNSITANFVSSQPAGAIISLTNVSGVLNGVAANATNNTKPAHCFINTSASGSNTSTKVNFTGINNFCSGLTPGGFCYLGLTSGIITQTKPTTSGNIVQNIGFALSSTSMFFNPDYQYIQL